MADNHLSRREVTEPKRILTITSEATINHLELLDNEGSQLSCGFSRLKLCMKYKVSSNAAQGRLTPSPKPQF